MFFLNRVAVSSIVDLTREEGKPDISRYNYAQTGKVMLREHDIWSLVKMTAILFEIDFFARTMSIPLDDMIQVFTEAQTCAWRIADARTVNKATGSGKFLCCEYPIV